MSGKSKLNKIKINTQRRFEIDESNQINARKKNRKFGLFYYCFVFGLSFN